MKTAIQQAIEHAENHTGIVTRQFWIDHLKSLLPAEQKQIEQAYRQGSITQYGHSRLNKTPTSRWQSIIDEETSDYFKTTYSNEGI